MKRRQNQRVIIDQRLHGDEIVDRLFRKLALRGGKVVARKESFLDHSFVKPTEPSKVATLAVGVAGVSTLAARDKTLMSRRQFGRQGLKLLVGSTTAAILLNNDHPKAHASSWGQALGLFAYCVGWLVGAWLEAEYSIDVDDFTYEPDPEPSGDDFNDAFAQPHVNGNKTTYFQAQRGLAMDEHLQRDFNGVELAQLHRERNLNGPMIAKTRRLEPKAKWRGGMNRIAANYGLLKGQAAVEYVNGLIERDGTEHIGVGVTLNDDRKAYLIS